jgi:hypothetical protein
LLPGDAFGRFFLLAIPGLWLLLPVALLSSLSTSSRWFVFRPVVVWNMLRLAPFTFMVYMLSALLAASVAGLAYVTLVCGWLVLAPAAAVATATAILIYGRLLGRLGWKMGRLYVSKQKRIKRARSTAAAPREPPPAPDDPLGPEELDPDWETTPYGQKRPRVKGYGVTQGAHPEQSIQRALPEARAADANEPVASDEADPQWEITPHGQRRRRTTSYGISQEPATASGAAPEEGVTSLHVPPPASVTDRPPASEPTDFDRIIRAKSRQITGSKRSFLGGVFSFPWYRGTRIPWLLLSMGFLVVYGAAYVMVSLYLTIYKGG